MAAKVASLLLLTILAIVSGRKGKFTIMSNLEKLFYMESEVLSLADIFIREEHFAHDGEDVHDLDEIQTMMKQGKDLHLNVTNITDYLAHPINVLHLTRRLYSDWRTALAVIADSEPCQKWHIPQIKLRMNNILRNFPTKHDVENVALSIAKIQYTEDINVNDIAAGLISGHRSLDPVTLTDLLDMMKAAYDGGQFLFTTKVAERIIRECKNSKEKEGCDLLKVYKIASFSYFKINKLKEAIEMTDNILKEVPDDSSAARNRRLYDGRLKSKNKGSDVLFDTSNIKYYQTCRGEWNMSEAQQSRLYCTLLPTSALLVYEKAEYHNIYPPVIEFHSTFNQSLLDEIKNAGEMVYQQQAHGEYFATPDFTQKPPPTHIYKLYSRRFVNLTEPMIGPMDIGTVEVRQIGMEGMYFRPKNRYTIPSHGSHVGSFFTFTNANFTGGEFVFPKYKLKIKPTAGNTVFFFATKSTLNICPVSYGVQWLAVQSLFEMPIRRTSRTHDEDI